MGLYALSHSLSFKMFPAVQTPELCLAAVQKNGFVLEFVKEQTPEICLAAVKRNGLALQFVKEQTPEICLAAVQKNGEALQFVKEQTSEICLAAVKRDGWALNYVKEQTHEICFAAVSNEPDAFDFVDPSLKYIFDIKIEPTTFVDLPSYVNWKELTDPITLDPLIKGEIYGWIVEGERWYLAGSLTSFNIMIRTVFKNSYAAFVFVPMKNSLYPVKDIQWVRI